MPDDLKPLVFVASARRDLKRMPVIVRQRIGRILGLVQSGDTPTNVKRLKGFSVSVLEICLQHDAEAYRAVYTVSLGNKVYLLHAFHKKSKSSVGIPQRDIEVIRQRLKDAMDLETQQHG